jgi:nitronate monooxygenase
VAFQDKFKPLLISGKEILPIVEGGKGVSVTNGLTAGAFAAAGGVGTFSGVNPDSFDKDGKIIPYVYHGKTRRERHEELIEKGISGGITQAKIAHEVSNGNGRIHINILWEMGGAEEILRGVLDGSKGLIHGVTCGAGMPYKLSEIAAEYNVYYYPIVSSARAFNALWKRSYSKVPELLGAVVYEDPWLAGGHNGLSNSEDPKVPQDPYPRVAAIRALMNSVGLEKTPIVMAGGAWHLSEWEHWLDNPEIGPVAFQFGTRPILTQESPVSNAWKKRLLTLKEGDVFLNNFSPTGFYSSAVNNDFIQELRERNERQVEYRTHHDEEFTAEFKVGARGRPIYVKEWDKLKVESFIEDGFTEVMKTPDSTVIFVTPDKAHEIHQDQVDCMGCLSHCRFSNWKDRDDYTTGKKADPRSFCIQKTLQHIAHDGSIEHNLMFSGHNAYRFASDPFYANGFVPTVKQLVDRIATGY